MKSDEKHIERINDFLEAIGVESLDIRLEMVDHIASEIENSVDDINAFFKDDGFQTPFLKYMLSRKDGILKRYNNQVKQLNWYYLKKLCKELFSLLLKPKFSFTITLLILVLVNFGSVYFKELSILFFTTVIVLYVYTAIKIQFFLKRFKELRFIKFYSRIISLFSLLILIFPSYIDVYIEGNYSEFIMYQSLFTLIITALIHFNFHRKSEIIKNKYNFLIQ
ncbi:hypothetical protein [Tenacibaculum jejuense]|uniref:Uncharacterized protein n=1 Tax=Tenacibaculum jejuense TaxID=584609 RepID=A0A238U472_9FLAO|nr:hypothetical protein [Tenacibaculum jejuense]SNR14003.1 membrane protein of unknown function [Tenacibaculum jejuense]